MDSWIESAGKYIANGLVTQDKFKFGKTAVVGNMLYVTPNMFGVNIGCKGPEGEDYYIAFTGGLPNQIEFLEKSITSFLKTLDNSKLNVRAIKDSLEFDFNGELERVPPKSTLWDISPLYSLYPPIYGYEYVKNNIAEILRGMGVKKELLSND